MEFLENTKYGKLPVTAGDGLYQALAVGDLPAAWLLARPLMDRTKLDRLCAPTAFNCGLCLYRLKEYEKALAGLRRAEQLLGTPPDLDIREKELFFRAVEADDQVFLRPLNPGGDSGLERYFLIRVRWLTAHCLLRLERRQEAAPAIRFLSQYHIKL
ncbi:MAG: hypothetical protein HFH93_08400 [Lachnospiraceae bacterium]|nr:hypothetical protein [Lachnospiraceae bacterium]